MLQQQPYIVTVFSRFLNQDLQSNKFNIFTVDKPVYQLGLSMQVSRVMEYFTAYHY
jgi:hypothetical protein